MKTRAFAMLSALLLAASLLTPNAGADPFLIGQRLAGQIGGSLMNTQTSFEATEAGKVRFELLEASPGLRARFTVTNSFGAIVKSWSARPGKRFRKNVRIPAAGTYLLQIQGQSPQPAAFVIQTRSRLGDPSKSAVSTATNGEVSLSFLAVAGERVSIAFLPFNWDIADHAGVTGPDLRRPDGTLLFGYESESAYGNSITDAAIDQTGAWTVTYRNLPGSTDQALLRVDKQNAAQAFVY